MRRPTLKRLAKAAYELDAFKPNLTREEARRIARQYSEAARFIAGPDRAQPEGRALSDEERYRKQAEDCRQMARKVISPLDKEAWLKLAGDWLRLADDADLREKPHRALVAPVWLKVLPRV